MSYNFQEIEKEAQKIWGKQLPFKYQGSNSKKKYYVLDMFPYPSGDGLHVGHVKGYTATDAVSHFMRLSGYDVLHPMGWDAFGLPAENYAIKVKKNPKEVVSKNIEKFRLQMKALGFSYDWSREINTTDPKYYKWTQWTFIQMFKNGLAYQDNVDINFCPSCKTGLSNEEVISGKCERCHSEVVKKKIRQWLLRITKYADRLLEDLDLLDWPEPIKVMQKNWIGKSWGTNVKFKTSAGILIKVFTTRIDTLFGCTYLVVSPEYKEINNLINKSKNKTELINYINKVKKFSEIKRTSDTRAKTGIKVEGIEAINPINNRIISIWVADYVLADYGTGAVMAVPAHDQRDFEFAKKYGIEIIRVISANKSRIKDLNNNSKLKRAFVDYGYLINSGEFNGLSSEEAQKKITQKLKKNKNGDFAVNYKLRDWIFSRQRYWGEPIPIVHCQKCGAVPLPEKELPLKSDSY